MVLEQGFGTITFYLADPDPLDPDLPENLIKNVKWNKILFYEILF